MSFKKSKKAFTILELLVVIATLSILFVVLVAHVDNSKDAEYKATMEAQMFKYERSSVMLAADYKGFPLNLEILSDKLNDILFDNTEFTVVETHLESNKKDPWGMPYRIDMTLPPDSNGQIQISCFGPDKTFDTEDDITIFVRYDKTNETGKIVLSSDGSDFYPYDDRVDRDNAINIEQPSWGENN